MRTTAGYALSLSTSAYHTFSQCSQLLARTEVHVFIACCWHPQRLKHLLECGHAGKVAICGQHAFAKAEMRFDVAAAVNLTTASFGTRHLPQMMQVGAEQCAGP